MTWDWKKIRKYSDTEETEIVFVERPSVYKVFSALIQPALSQIISNATNKTKDRTFSAATDSSSDFCF